MTKRMLVDATHPEETRVAIVDERRLEDFDFESASKKQLKGNIYLAKVVRIEPSLQAAFVEYGGNRHGFLPFSEIHPDYFRIPMADRPHDEDGNEIEEDEGETDGESEGEVSGLSAEAYAEEVRAYQAEQAHDLDHAHIENPIALAEVVMVDAPLVIEATVETTVTLETVSAEPVTIEIAPVETTIVAPDAAPVVEEQNVEAHIPETMGGFGVDAALELGLITDFGNAAVDPSFVPAPSLEVVGGEVAEEEEGEERVRRPRRPNYKIQEVVKRRQIMLIQVVKEERGNKGAALTTFLSLAGRYCVLMPNTDRGGGVSRKITSHQERKRMKDMLDQLETPEGMAVILRTAGMEQEPAEIQRDLEHLLRLWNNIREQTLASTAPTLIYEEANLIKRSIRDLYAADVAEILVAGQKGYDLAHEFMRSLMPEDQDKVHLYEDPVPLFFRYNVEKQIDGLYNPVVQLRSGGYIVINPTEALVSIDVNSGRATRERHIEGTALKTNLEAADEVARQLRLRDLAGLIVIDYIDMEDGRNNAAVERRMKEAMKADRARLQIGRISPFGLMELSRQRLHPSLTEINFERCPHCAGVGLVRSVDSSAISILRMIEEEGIRQPSGEMVLHVPTKVALYILNQKRADLHAIERRYNLQVLLHSDDTLVPPDCRLERVRIGSGEARSRAAVDSDQILAEGFQTDNSEASDTPNEEVSTPPRAENDRNNRTRRPRVGRNRNRDRDNRSTPQGNAETLIAETNGNVVPSDMTIDDNIGNVMPVDGEAVDGNAPRPGQDPNRQGGRRRGRRGGRGRRNGQRDGQAPREVSEGGQPPREPRVYEPRQPAQMASVPVSIHDLDTTPRDTRGSNNSSGNYRPVTSAPPPSPYEVNHSDSDKPKGGWWRKLTGQSE